MTGMEAITNQIKSDCEKQILKINAAADEAIKKILEKAQKTAEENTKKIDAAARRKAEQEVQIAKSGARLTVRNEMLAAKREEIDKTISLALEQVCALPDEAYFECFYQLVKKMKGQSGDILLNERDLKRLPADFQKKMRACGVKGKVNPEPAPIRAGFILKNGDIEENADFEVLFADNRDRLEDLVNSCLFTE